MSVKSGHTLEPEASAPPSQPSPNVTDLVTTLTRFRGLRDLSGTALYHAWSPLTGPELPRGRPENQVAYDNGTLFPLHPEAGGPGRAEPAGHTSREPHGAVLPCPQTLALLPSLCPLAHSGVTPSPIPVSQGLSLTSISHTRLGTTSVTSLELMTSTVVLFPNKAAF